MIFVDSIDDPRLTPYRNLKDRELARLGGRFIAESEFIVRRLLISDYRVESLLVARRKADALAPLVSQAVPMYVLPEDQLDAVIGYPFHTGVLAVGLRSAAQELTAVLPEVPRRSLVVVLPEITNPENMGSIVRVASAFGADAIVLGPRCCDPFYRLSIRVSMGTIFSIPVIRVDDLPAVMAELREQHRYELVATVLDPNAEPLAKVRPADRTAILLGNEANGLSPVEAAACDRKVTVPMKRGTDSLNVAVAAGVFLNHFTAE